MKDEILWSEVVKDLAPGLYRYFCGSFEGATASDLVQETFIRLIRKKREGSFDISKGSLKSFAYGIARFIRLENLKAPYYSEISDEAERAVDLRPRADFSDPVTHLRWAIAQLRDVEQELVLLHIDEELTLDEISKQLDLPLNTVKSHIHRAKNNLRELMEVNDERQQR